MSQDANLEYEACILKESVLLLPYLKFQAKNNVPLLYHYYAS